MAGLKSLPIDPLLHCEAFIEANPFVQNAVFWLLIKSYYSRKWDCVKNSQLEKLSNTTHSTWTKNKTQILLLYKELMPKILSIRGINKQSTDIARIASIKAMSKHKAACLANEREASQAQPAPLEPQKSASNAKKTRQSLTSNEHFTIQHAEKPSQPRFQAETPSVQFTPPPAQYQAPVVNQPVVYRPMRIKQKWAPELK
jgi:FtsZ-interacting cell division protein ZipA